MTKIIITNNRIIFDGHADTVQECETITLLANALAESENFKTIKYESGYAEFEKVGKAEELKFVRSGIAVYFDENIISVTAFGNTVTTSGDSILDGMGSAEYTVVVKDGYVIDTVTGSTNFTISNITDNTFYAEWVVGAYGDITITSKLATPSYPKINSFTYFGKQINSINGKPIRYVHDNRAGAGNTYEMVYLDPNANYLLDANGLVLQDCDGNYLEFTEEAEFILPTVDEDGNITIVQAYSVTQIGDDIIIE